MAVRRTLTIPTIEPANPAGTEDVARSVGSIPEDSSGLAK
jgi:hypothetical protein